MPETHAVCPAAQDQVSSLPLLPSLVTVNQPVSATIAAPGVAVAGSFPSGFHVQFSPGQPAPQVCTANRPMHVEYASYTGAQNRCALCLLLCRPCEEPEPSQC